MKETARITIVGKKKVAFCFISSTRLCLIISKKLIENHTFEDGKASYLYIIEHVSSTNKMRMLALIRQLKDMKMKDHDDPDVFIGKYLDIVSSLKDGGHHLPEDDQNS